MKLVYLTNDGKARVETAKVGTRLIEMPDGYHPITNDSVWQDAARKSDGMMILFQGVLPAYGGTMAEHDTLNVLREVEYAEKSFKPMSNSKMWQRSLAGLWAFGMKYGISFWSTYYQSWHTYNPCHPEWNFVLTAHMGLRIWVNQHCHMCWSPNNEAHP